MMLYHLLATLATPKRGFVVLLLMLAAFVSGAQPAAVVSGVVRSAGGAPIEFATVTLHQATDSAVVKTEFSNAQGNFRLEAAAGRRYRMSAVQVGFERSWGPVFELPTDGLTLPALALPSSAATTLKEVTVMAHKPLYERLADRTIVNVEDSPSAAGSTTLDLLGRAPGVTLDADNNLALRGRQGLLVVIDGKRQPMTGTELADYLRALPAEQLKSIELITNPPASYDAQGGAGVIAINLKKDQREGTNGTANASYGRGRYGKFTAGLGLNYRHKKLNIFGNYAYAERRGYLELMFDRRFGDSGPAPPGQSWQNIDQRTFLRSHIGKMGFDYTISPRTSLGMSVNALHAAANLRAQNQAQQYNEKEQLNGRFTSVGNQEVTRPSASLNLNLRHSFADSANASTLTLDADYARYNTSRLLALNTTYMVPAPSGALLNGNQQTSLIIESFKVDYSRPLLGRSRLEMGVKTTLVRADNNVTFANTVDGVTKPVTAISNQFWYDENVNAAYLSLSRPWAQTTLRAGLRAEQANTLARQATDSYRQERHYIQLFPSVSVQHTLSGQHALGLALSRRINRPSYMQLNPLRSYLDINTYSSGNPDLRPETSYSADLTHTYRQKFVVGLSYARTDHPIVRVVQPSPDGGRQVVNRDVNLMYQNYCALTVTAPLEPAKWWSLYLNAVGYYAHFVGFLSGTSLDRGQPAFNMTANNTFTLPGGWLAELNGEYQSNETYGFEVVQPRGQVALGLQKSVFDKQASLRLSVADIFYTTPVYSTATYDGFSESFRSAQDTQVATLAFSYRFGSAQVAAARRRATGAEEELRRASGQ